MAEGPLRPLRQFVVAVGHQGGQIRVAVRILAQVARGRLAERGQEIVVLLLPRIGLIGLAQPAGRADGGLQPQQIPVDVGVLGAVAAANPAVDVAGRHQSVVQGIGVLKRSLPQHVNVVNRLLQLRPDRFQPGLVLRQHGMTHAGPDHDAVLFEIQRAEHLERAARASAVARYTRIPLRASSPAPRIVAASSRNAPSTIHKLR